MRPAGFMKTKIRIHTYFGRLAERTGKDFDARFYPIRRFDSCTFHTMKGEVFLDLLVH